MYSKIFWRDVENYIRRKTGQTLKLKGKDVFIYFQDDGTDKDFSFFVQLFLILGKYHIHKKKWADSKPNFEHFLAELKQYHTTVKDIKNRKAIKTDIILSKYV